MESTPPEPPRALPLTPPPAPRPPRRGSDGAPTSTIWQMYCSQSACQLLSTEDASANGTAAVAAAAATRAWQSPQSTLLVPDPGDREVGLVPHRQRRSGSRNRPSSCQVKSSCQLVRPAATCAHEGKIGPLPTDTSSTSPTEDPAGCGLASSRRGGGNTSCSGLIIILRE